LQEADVYEISLTGRLTPAETINREDVQK